jgi:hypothetical protein
MKIRAIENLTLGHLYIGFIIIVDVTCSQQERIGKKFGFFIQGFVTLELFLHESTLHVRKNLQHNKKIKKIISIT